MIDNRTERKAPPSDYQDPFVRVVWCGNCGKEHPTHVYIRGGAADGVGSVIGKCSCGERLWGVGDL